MTRLSDRLADHSVEIHYRQFDGVAPETECAMLVFAMMKLAVHTDAIDVSPLLAFGCWAEASVHTGWPDLVDGFPRVVLGWRRQGFDLS